MTAPEVPRNQACKQPTQEPSWRNLSYWHPQDFTTDTAGRWLLFYRRADLDSAWLMAKQLCDARLLPGVVFLQCATAHLPRAKDEYPIQFYTAALPDGELLETGRQVAKTMSYKPLDGRTSICWLRCGAREDEAGKMVLDLRPASSPF